MRVTKKAGKFVFSDEPMRFEGKAARHVISEMTKRDASGNDVERTKFLDECERISKTLVVQTHDGRPRVTRAGRHFSFLSSAKVGW